MPRKIVSEETKEAARELRKGGATIESIAQEFSISTGEASTICRGIEKPSRSTESQKERSPRSRDILDTTLASKPDTDTIELANRVRRERLQAELDEIEDRKRQRERMRELEGKERELRLELDKARTGGDIGQVTELRHELDALRDLMHTREIERLERQISSLGQLVARGSGTLGRYDLMSQAMGKAEGAFIHLSDKVDKFLSSSKGDSEIKNALSLGLSLDEYHTLKLGPERVPTEVEWQAMRAAQARATGESVKVEPGEYQQIRQLCQVRNERYSAVANKARANLAGGSAATISAAKSKQVNRTKTGPAPVAGAPEPVVLKADSKVVKCQRCGTTFDVDITQAKQSAAPGKRLYVECPGKNCSFMLEITDMVMPPVGVIPERMPGEDDYAYLGRLQVLLDSYIASGRTSAANAIKERIATL